jgi:hypothetical protein
MIMAPLTALSWEILGRNRSALLMNVAISAVLGIAINAGGLAGPMSIMILVSFSLLFSSAFAYVDLNPRGTRGGFPRHILVLPLATWVLALVPILGGAAFISAFVLLWLRFLTGLHLSIVEQLAVAGAITAMLCWMQAMSWELIRLRMARLALLAVVFILASVSLASLLSADEGLFLGRTGGVITLLTTLSSGYGFAWLAVVRSRRGDAGEPGSSGTRLRTSSALYIGASRVPDSGGGLAAQNWYESRVFGRLLPVCILFFCALFMSMLFLDGVRHSPSAIEIGLVLFTFCLTAPLVGSAYAWKSPHVPRAMLSPFFAALPLDDVELAFAKLSVSARSHLLSVAIVLVTIAGILLISDDNRHIERVWSYLLAHQGMSGAVCAALLLLLFTTVTTWTAGAYLLTASFYFAVVDWKRSWKYVVEVLVLLAVWKYSGWLRPNRHTLELMLAHADKIALALLAASAIFAAISFRRYCRSHPLSALGKVLVGFVALTTVSLVLIWQLTLSAQLHWALSGFAVAAGLNALIPILRIPGLIEMNRHR